MTCYSLLHSGQFSTDKILRERQRQEICGALRGSNLYYNMYMIKNNLEIILSLLFISVNTILLAESSDDTELCGIQMEDKQTLVGG